MNPPRKNLERMLSDSRIGELASMPEAPPRFTAMAAPSETTTERHVRVCPQHGVEIQETRGGKLVCPKGWHPVGKFRVVDTLKHRVVEATVDGGGIQEMAGTRLGSGCATEELDQEHGAHAGGEVRRQRGCGAAAAARPSTHRKKRGRLRRVLDSRPGARGEVDDRHEGGAVAHEARRSG